MNRGFRVYSPPEVDRIWLWAYYNKIPIYPIFYLPQGTTGFSAASKLERKYVASGLKVSVFKGLRVWVIKGLGFGGLRV